MLKREQGTTLVEVVLAVAIFSLLLTTVLTFYYGSLQSWRRSLNTMDIQQNARIAMDEIIRKLRYAHTLEGFQNENVLPLYRHGNEEQRGANSLRFTGLDEEDKLCSYMFSFDESKKSVNLKSGKGTPNEIAYHVAGLDFFRYIPRGVLPEEDFQEASPMILVILRLQEKDQYPAQGAPYILQSVVRLQNLALPVE